MFSQTLKLADSRTIWANRKSDTQQQHIIFMVIFNWLYYGSLGSMYMAHDSNLNVVLLTV